MKLNIKNLGPIRNGQIDLEKCFHVFVGYNSSGKTYASQLLWGLFEEEFLHDFLIKSKTTKAIPFSFDKPFVLTETLMQQYCEEYQNYIKTELLPQILRIKKNESSIINDLYISFIQPEFSKVKSVKFIGDYSFFENGKLYLQLVAKKNKNALKITIRQEVKEVKVFEESQKEAPANNFELEAKVLIGEAIFNALFDARVPFFLPSDRTFFPAYHNYIQLAARRSQELTLKYINNGKGTVSSQTLKIISSIPYSQATEQLVTFIENLSIVNGGQQVYKDLIQQLEKILGGKITNELNKIEGITSKLSFGINLEKQGLKLPIELASSSINQLTTLYLYFKYWAKSENNFLIIDEPEQNLHPKNQIALLNLLMEFANKNNNRVLINTHSPLLTDAINNHLRLGYLKKNIGVVATQQIIENNGIHYNMESAMKPDSIGIYFFDGRNIEEYEVEEYGAFFRDFRKEEKEIERTANVLKNAIYDNKKAIQKLDIYG